MRQQTAPNCPLHKFKPCKQYDCAWYTQVRGKDPQSEKEIDEYGCAIAWLPILLIENAQQSRQTGAAVESFRNEATRAVAETLLTFSNVRAIK